MFICRNAEGVRGQRKVGNPCSSAIDWRVMELLRQARNRFFTENYRQRKLCQLQQSWLITPWFIILS